MGTSIHKSVFSKIGYFDEINFPQYHGDADYGLRAKEAGYTLTVYPELKIWNDRDNTGYSNDKSFAFFIKSLTSKKSNKNIYRDYLFYRKHCKTPRAYLALIRKYFYHIGGFVKWKFLGFLGLKRKKRY
jgi:GT2 family glycosyltransferase